MPEIQTPPGYKSVVPFDTAKHAGLGVRTDIHHTFAAPMNTIFLTVTEFQQAARNYPIIFIMNPETKTLLPFIATGLNSGENLFVDENGDWKTGFYVPAYVRRYPFYTVGIRNNDDTPATQMIVVEEAGLSEDAPPLIDGDGKMTENWPNVEKFIKDIDMASLATSQFMDTLAGYELFEQFEATIQQKSGKEVRMTGMYRVSMEKLKALPDETLRELLDKDYLFAIDVHRMSLDNFRNLIERIPNNAPA